MKSKKKFERELLNTVTNKIEDDKLSYQNIKSKINIDYTKTFKFSYFLNYALSFVIVILAIFCFIHIKHGNNQIPNDSASENTPEPGATDSSDKQNIYLNNDYYIEFLFIYDENDKLYDNNKKYFSKLGLNLNVNYSKKDKKAYINVKGSELLNLQKKGLENELKKASEHEFVFDIIEYDMTNKTINNYYKKDFKYNNLIIKTNRFLNDDSEIKISITLNYRQDPSSEINNIDYNKNYLLQYESIIKNNANSYSSFDEPKIFYIYNSYTDFLKDYEDYLKLSDDSDIIEILVEQIS